MFFFPADTGVTFLHIRGYALVRSVGGSKEKVVARYTGKYFRIDDSFPDIERLCFGNDFVITVKQDRENIQFQCFCQIECSFVETFSSFRYRYVCLPGKWRWSSLPSLFFRIRSIYCSYLAYIIEVDITNDGSEERRVPYPMVGYHQDFRRKRQQYQNIDERLVVGDNNCRMLETLVGLVDMFFFDGSG